ncbi:hypothetical protein DPMN_066979 [Dreissena polymorpha]|uniref:Uncharacterized protein n=1 Tax=Dreissena polymorpha TaxID=45954 RepID=A0A9D4BT70_DREPO|nr:hypothetical protein DPMN_066979 [Dreissena polymorpha]
MAQQRPTRIPTPQATMCLSFKVLVIIVKEKIVARTTKKAILGGCGLCGRGSGVGNVAWILSMLKLILTTKLA